MKPRKVKHARFIIGIQMIAQVLTSLDAKNHGAEMETWPMGLYAKVPDKNGGFMEKIIPYAQIQYLDLYPEEVPAKAK